MIPYTWIIKCFKMYKISDKVIQLIWEAMKNMKVKNGRQMWADGKISRDIFYELLSTFKYILLYNNYSHLDCISFFFFINDDELLWRLSPYQRNVLYLQLSQTRNNVLCNQLIGLRIQCPYIALDLNINRFIVYVYNFDLCLHIDNN